MLCVIVWIFRQNSHKTFYRGQHNVPTALWFMWTCCPQIIRRWQIWNNVHFKGWSLKKEYLIVRHSKYFRPPPLLSREDRKVNLFYCSVLGETGKKVLYNVISGQAICNLSLKIYCLFVWTTKKKKYFV